MEHGYFPSDFPCRKTAKNVFFGAGILWGDFLCCCHLSIITHPSGNATVNYEKASYRIIKRIQKPLICSFVSLFHYSYLSKIFTHFVCLTEPLRVIFQVICFGTVGENESRNLRIALKKCKQMQECGDRRKLGSLQLKRNYDYLRLHQLPQGLCGQRF